MGAVDDLKAAVGNLVSNMTAVDNVIAIVRRKHLLKATPFRVHSPTLGKPTLVLTTAFRAGPLRVFPMLGQGALH